MKTKRLLWTVAFLGVTLVAIVMECVAGLWHPAGWMIPWTEYIARYVPWPIQLLAYVALAVWLPIHFWHHDHMRGLAYQQGKLDLVEQVRRIVAASEHPGLVDADTLTRALDTIARDTAHALPRAQHPGTLSDW